MNSSATEMENDSVVELDELLSEVCGLKTEKSDKSGVEHKKENRFIGIVAGAVIVFLSVIVGAYFLLQKKEAEASSYESLKIALSSDFVDRDAYQALQEKAKALTASTRDLTEQMTALGNKMNDISSDFDATETQYMESEAWTEKSSKMLSDMEQRIEKLEKINARQSIPPKQKASAPRFDLDIDGLGVWNGVPFVSVGYQGHYLMIEVGQRVNGWQLVSLDPVARLAEFEYKTGVKIKRKV